MKITVAGEKKEVKEGLTLAELIEQEKVENPEYVTVSVNEEFVESGSFAGHILKEGDEVEFLYFMGGGAIMTEVMILDGSDQAAAEGREGAISYNGGGTVGIY